MATPKHGHSPITMRARLKAVDFEQVGDFCWGGSPGREVLVIAIPDTEHEQGWITSRWTIDHKNHCDAQWSWDGKRDKPTLTPSLHAVDTWHGYVREGMLVEA